MPVASGNYSQQGQRLTVNTLIKDPLIIRQRMLDISRNQFMMEDLLRRVPGTQSGVVQYTESAPLFASEDPSIVAEGAEIPIITGEDGVPKAAFTIKMGAGIEITREARDRNRIDKVDQRMKQVRNTFVRAWERRMFTALDSADTNAPLAATDAAGDTTAWQHPDAPIRTDILTAMRRVREASLTGPAGGSADTEDFLGFEPDTLVMSTRTQALFFANNSVIDVYRNGSTLDTKNPMYTGTLERDFMGLRVLTSRFMADDFVWVVQRKEVGGYSDERPFNVSPLREDADRELWRANAVRRTAIFVDQPKAAIKIEGITGA